MRYALFVALSLVLPSTAALAYHQPYAPVTPTISCPADWIVWVNTRTGIYHLEAGMVRTYQLRLVRV